MVLYTFLLISRQIVDGVIYGNQGKNNRLEIKVHKPANMANEVYGLKLKDSDEILWLMEYEYTNFGKLDDDGENYFGAVVLDEDIIVKLDKDFPQKHHRKSKWGITNDTKTYVKNPRDTKDNVDEKLLVDFVDLAVDGIGSEEIKDKAFMLKNLNHKEKIRIGGNLYLYYDKNIDARNRYDVNPYHRLSRIIMGEYTEPYHKGHIFDYRKQALEAFDSDEQIESRRKEEAKAGIVRGKLITHSLNDATRQIEGKTEFQKKIDPKSVSGVLVIDSELELIALFEHLISKEYEGIIK